MENLSTSENYITYNGNSLKDAFISLFNNKKINLVQIPNAAYVKELKAANITGIVEAIKIINHSYGMRWLIWNGISLYYAFAWNANENVIVKKIS